MKINDTMSISRILTDVCAIKSKIKIKDIFENVAYSVLVVKNIDKW